MDKTNNLTELEIDVATGPLGNLVSNAHQTVKKDGVTASFALPDGVVIDVSETGWAGPSPMDK